MFSPAPALHDPLRQGTEPQQLRLLRTKSVELEAQFLSEMLRHAGLNEVPDGFGGGSGEEQFASFLREAQASAIARRGGIGLAEHLFNALKARSNAAG